MKTLIRQEEPQDFDTVREVVRSAFATSPHTDGNEHNLVEKLRNSDAFIPKLSLVAILDDKIVGHLMMTMVTIENDEETVDSLGLAPLSVLPEYQNRGVGGALVHRAFADAKKLGFESVVVLGDPGYYSRFGFTRADELDIEPDFKVPPEYFLVCALRAGALNDVYGTAVYAKEFYEE
ncbi:N-acetyltransferase [Oscillospiraceae bacterium PP1C4]